MLGRRALQGRAGWSAGPPSGTRRPAGPAGPAGNRVPKRRVATVSSVKRSPGGRGGFCMRRVLVTIAVIALAVVLGAAAAGCKKSGSSGGGSYMGRPHSQVTSSA